MGRLTLIYVLTIVLFVAGLWTVLVAGTRLDAPPHLSGRWQTAEGLEVVIHQSGRYVHVESDGVTASVLLRSWPPGGPGVGGAIEAIHTGPAAGVENDASVQMTLGKQRSGLTIAGLPLAGLTGGEPLRLVPAEGEARVR